MNGTLVSFQNELISLENECNSSVYFKWNFFLRCENSSVLGLGKPSFSDIFPVTGAQVSLETRCFRELNNILSLQEMEEIKKK